MFISVLSFNLSDCISVKVNGKISIGRLYIMLSTGNSLFIDVGNLDNVSALQCSLADVNFTSY